MTNYNDGNWHGWNGGECPVHPDTVVEYQCYARGVVKASGLAWEHDGTECDIIAFRVTKEHKEPREFWCREVVLPNGRDAMVQCDPDHAGAVLFREVSP